MDRLGRTLGRDRAVAAAPTTTAAPVPESQALRQPRGVVRDPVRALHGDSVGVPAPRARVRVGDDLLASVAGLERRRRVATPARSPTRQAESRRPARHVPGGDRRNPCSGPQGRPRLVRARSTRRKPGSKHHVITGAGAIPLAVSLTGGNRHDVTNSCPWSTRSRRSRASEADPGNDPSGSTPTAARFTSPRRCLPGRRRSSSPTTGCPSPRRRSLFAVRNFDLVNATFRLHPRLARKSGAGIYGGTLESFWRIHCFGKACAFQVVREKLGSR